MIQTPLFSCSSNDFLLQYFRTYLTDVFNLRGINHYSLFSQFFLIGVSTSFALVVECQLAQFELRQGFPVAKPHFFSPHTQSRRLILPSCPNRSTGNITTVAAFTAQLDEATKQTLSQDNPLEQFHGQMIQVAEVADIVAFLCSQKTKWSLLRAVTQPLRTLRFTLYPILISKINHMFIP